MIEERFAKGSHEELEHRGREFTVWRTFSDDGRRIRRSWHFEACGHRNNCWLKSKEEAIRAARRTINYELDGRFYWDMLYSIFDDEVPLSFYETGQTREDVTPTPDAADDRQTRVRECLKGVTVERGFSAAEEATAAPKLVEMDKVA